MEKEENQNNTQANENQNLGKENEKPEESSAGEFPQCCRHENKELIWVSVILQPCTGQDKRMRN